MTRKFVSQLRLPVEPLTYVQREFEAHSVVLAKKACRKHWDEVIDNAHPDLVVTARLFERSAWMKDGGTGKLVAQMEGKRGDHPRWKNED